MDDVPQLLEAVRAGARQKNTPRQQEYRARIYTAEGILLLKALNSKTTITRVKIP